MYGQDISRRVHSNNTIDLFDATSIDRFTKSNISIKQTLDSVDYILDEVIVDTASSSVFDKNENGLFINRDLFYITWNQKGASVKIKPIKTDFNNKKVLNINLLIDPVSNLNNKDKPQQFSIVLRDLDSNTAVVVTAENQNILTSHFQKIIQVIFGIIFSRDITIF